MLALPIAPRHRSRYWVPRDVAGGACLWVPPETSYTIAGLTVPVQIVGSGSPAVTVTGTPAATVTGFRVKITLGGARGTSTFSYSADDGATYTAGGATAASVGPLGSTGITVLFATGTSTLNDVWSAYPSPSQINDQSGNGNHIKQATQTKQIGVQPNVINGRPAFLSTLACDAATDASSLGANTDFTAFAVVWPTLLTGSAVTGTVISTVGGANGYGNIDMLWSASSTSGNFLPGTDQTNRIATGDGYVTLAAQILMLKKSGAGTGNLSCKRNSVNSFVNTGKTAVAPTSGAHRFGNFNGTAGSVGWWVEPVIVPKAVTAAEELLFWQYYSRKYGIVLA